MIKVLFFAQLKETLGCEQLQVEAVDTVAQLRQTLSERSTQWAEVLAAQTVLVAVNQTMASDEQTLNDGDEVAFFPPVTGG